MNKIFYDKDGYVCNRFPLDKKVDDENRYIEVSDEQLTETLQTPVHYAWFVEEGQLVNKRYEEIPQEELIQQLRERRERVCFPIINRGQAWYAALTNEQVIELQTWYQAWLDVTDTKIIPSTPDFIK